MQVDEQIGMLHRRQWHRLNVGSRRDGGLLRPTR